MDFSDKIKRKMERHYATESKPGKIMAGVLVMLAGGALLAHEMGVVFPDWFFSWQMFLIALGLFLGLKKMFRSGGWYIPFTIGLFFLVDEYLINIALSQYFWPLLIIGIGLLIVIKSSRKKKDCYVDYENISNNNFGETTIKDNTLNTTSIFGGVKKNITSKDFKGGEITCVMGGAEIDLTQADIQGEVTLNVTLVFGGTSLIVPSNWQIKSESTVFMSSIEDRRVTAINTSPDGNKILVIKGSTVFGGIDIKNY